jgi:hypothetical protein
MAETIELEYYGGPFDGQRARIGYGQEVVRVDQPVPYLDARGVKVYGKRTLGYYVVEKYVVHIGRKQITEGIRLEWRVTK